jgi:hypothetical protein
VLDGRIDYSVYFYSVSGVWREICVENVEREGVGHGAIIAKTRKKNGAAGMENQRECTSPAYPPSENLAVTRF